MADAAPLTLRQRARRPTPAELAAIPWLQLLDGAQRERAMATLEVGDAEPGDRLCRIGRPATLWFGVIEGLLKMNNDDSAGQPITFTGIPPGGWFGEGTLIKRESYRYNVQALRRSVVAGLPGETFHWLLDHSIAFNRFVMNQLNERLAQFIAAREIDRMSNPDLRVAVPGLTVKGDGDLDLRVLGMDYRVGVIIEGDKSDMPDPACEVNKRYVGIEWPLRCRGPLELGAKACRLDQDGIGRIAGQLAGQRLNEKLEEKFGDKVSPDLKDALKNLLKKK